MSTRLHTSLKFLGVMFFLTACGKQTVTESMLTGNQDLNEAIDVHTSHKGDSYASVMVDTLDPLLVSQTNITRYAGRTLTGLPQNIAAEKLLSPYAESTAYSYSNFSGPNCWHTSIASLFKEWIERRHMSGDEFSCVLRTYFVEVKSPHFGDVIRFRDENGGEVHGATFIGIDSTTEEAVVYTKNGYAKSEPWGFMSLADVKKVYPEATSVRFFSPTREAIEPRDTDNPCNNEYRSSRHDQEVIETDEARQEKNNLVRHPL